MEMIGLQIFAFRFPGSTLAGISFLMLVFTSRIGWGFAYLFLPSPCVIIWLATSWQQGRDPFVLNLGTIIPMVVGMTLAIIGHHQVPQRPDRSLWWWTRLELSKNASMGATVP